MLSPLWLLLASYWLLDWLTIRPWRCNISLKHRRTSTWLHGVTCQKLILLIVTVLRISNPEVGTMHGNIHFVLRCMGVLNSVVDWVEFVSRPDTALRRNNRNWNFAVLLCMDVEFGLLPYVKNIDWGCENRMLRRIFWLKREEAAVEWGKPA